MRVLLAHNAYQQAGGEDVVFQAEGRLLEERGHKVVRYAVDNAAISEAHLLRTAAQTLWNGRTYREIAELCREHKPDVAHFHNTFPLMSPAGYYAARRSGVPVVQTLHNYRLVCPNALLYRDGHVCQDCFGRLLSLPGIRHSCYRGSRGASAATAAMLAFHRLKRTWTRQVDAYIALTELAKGKFVENGFSADRIHVKPNFLEEDPGEGGGDGGHALFVGRLATEKGLGVLLDAWQTLGGCMPLKIVGTGPEEETVRSRASGIAGVEVLGRVERGRVVQLLKTAACLVFPSQWYEPFGLTIVEAFAVGTPVIASDVGSAVELLQEGVTGMLFKGSDPSDLVSTVRRATSDPGLLPGMRQACRREFLSRYTADANYERLIEIYAAAQEEYARSPRR